VTERGKDDRLEGVIVRRIWMCSKLDREKLRAIWYDLHFLPSSPPFRSIGPRVLIHSVSCVCRNDCEGSDTGSLDVDAFVKAMWRIDEELRKARLNPSSFGPNSGYGSLSEETAQENRFDLKVITLKLCYMDDICPSIPKLRARSAERCGCGFNLDTPLSFSGSLGGSLALNYCLFAL
jgi:hypothetical protein